MKHSHRFAKNLFKCGLMGWGFECFWTGSFLKKKGCCPWDYSDAKHNYKGIIRLDYIPVWFLVGLIYERVLTKPTSEK